MYILLLDKVWGFHYSCWGFWSNVILGNVIYLHISKEHSAFVFKVGSCRIHQTLKMRVLHSLKMGYVKLPATPPNIPGDWNPQFGSFICSKYSFKWCLKNFSWLAKEFMMKVIVFFHPVPYPKKLRWYLFVELFFLPSFHFISIILTTAVIICSFAPAVFTQVYDDSPSQTSIFGIYMWSMFKFVHDYKVTIFQKIN